MVRSPPCPEGVNSIPIRTSEDGIVWTRVQEEPILTSSEVPFAEVAALASSALVLEDGTWVLYFYTWDEWTWPKSTGNIGMATALDPLGPWTVVSRPILRSGGLSDWDGEAVRTPSVIQTEDGFVMYYTGVGNSQAAIGRATSPDGRTWAKHDDPATEENPYAKSDPVFDGSGEQIWDRKNAFQPHVQLTLDGWVMHFASSTNVTQNPVRNQHGLAFSTDGIEWTRSETPIFSPSQIRSSGQNIWFAEMVYAQETYFVYVELGTGSNTEVYVATLPELVADE